jgi:hypothetical protein
MKAEPNTIEPSAPVVQAAPAAIAEAPRHAHLLAREDPQRLEGDDLRRLAYQRGIARSQLATMDDAKIRRELHFIIARQYEQRTAG